MPRKKSGETSNQLHINNSVYKARLAAAVKTKTSLESEKKAPRK